MPAEVIGFLREDATYGERETLKYLRANLPRDFTVYVETPIHKKRQILYPDFTILTNYGYIVLEVKDWVQLVQIDPNGARVRTRTGEESFHHNPVTQTREKAIALSENVRTETTGLSTVSAIPWGYAVLLINLPYSIITQVRRPWGEDFVLGKDDIDNPDLLLNRLKMTITAERMRSLTKPEIARVRAAIFPESSLEKPGGAVILDQEQERIVGEVIKSETPIFSEKAKNRAEAEKAQSSMFGALNMQAAEAKTDEGNAQVENLGVQTSIRLVRGFAGSGKSIVLVQRARYLANLYPEWKIGVLTFNKQLNEKLQIELRGTQAEVRTFHSLCLGLLRKGEAHHTDSGSWLESAADRYPIISELGLAAVKREMDWIRDMGLADLASYLEIKRHGIGQEFRLEKEQRRQIFSALTDYRSEKVSAGLWDWPDLSVMALDALKTGSIRPEPYDVILVDEAQDWAPSWLRVLDKLLKPEGYLFLADDPSQSIYRSFSWKDKGINVVGKTRWLRIPYRNTLEIYKAAYALISEHPGIQKLLADSSELVRPDLEASAMRRGQRPILQKFLTTSFELKFIRDRIISLRSEGYHDEQVAVLLRYKNDVQTVQNALKGTKAIVQPMSGYKGLETEVVILPFLNNTFRQGEPDAEAYERRLLYMAMTRAREKLFMTFTGKLNRAYEVLRRDNLADLIS